ncbi:MAG: hypothetical protein ACP5OV_07140 [Acidimicrobiales bacterium]
MSDGEGPVERFLHQDPAPLASDPVARAPRGARARRRRGWLTHFLFDKRPSPYSSIAPRRADGTRTKPFFFNGSGRGR